MTNYSSSEFSYLNSKEKIEAGGAEASLQKDSQITEQEFVIPLDNDEFIPSVSRWVTLGGAFLLSTVGIGVGLAAITPFPDTVRASASVRPDGEVKIVQAATEGIIEKLEVEETQKVEQGQVIARIDDSRLRTRKSQLENSIQQGQIQIQMLDTQRMNLSSQIAAEQNLMARSITLAQAELIRIEREYTDKQAVAVKEVQEAEAHVASAKGEFEAWERLGKEGAAAQVEVESKRQAYIAAQARLERVQTTLNPTSATVSVAQEQIAQSRARGESISATLQRDVGALLQQKVQIQAQVSKDQKEIQQVINELKDTIVRAQTDGTILKMDIRNEGQFVRPGEVIAHISPQDTPLVIKARVSPQDIGKVKVGQEVKMRVSAYTYTDYGTLDGNVISVAADATAPQAQPQEPSKASPESSVSPYFEITIQPKQTYLRKGDYKHEIQAGMEVQADIISQKETVLTFILRKARLLMGV
ncbi:HlyD family efflux transporter periplasmic adaptor subunit [Leptolyngbya sp. KIOST-1]|uniref:HlyD family efflux transporter periplasmic adaptor subunit n=1 Tax=Leptolyngbya sp. KIOST-1 TaxID=1229172 RepID=UPI00068E7A82|nr:HlyD family efflux transporter periplasmic adaptor subunit [Leptolyngbya sp. KIOST-1]